MTASAGSPSLRQALRDPLRRHLFRDLMLLVLIGVAILAIASLLLMRDIERDLAKRRLQSASALVRDEVNGLLLPVQQQLLILRDGILSRALTPADAEALNTELMPALTHMNQIAGAAYADASGQEYLLRRDDDEWLTRELEGLGLPDASANGVKATAMISRWANAHLRLSVSEEPTERDPRTRPWYQGAEQALRQQSTDAADAEPAPVISWTMPYRFFWLNEPGVTVSTAWPSDPGLRVLALDITLARILDTIDRLNDDGSVRGFLFSRDGGAYGRQSDPKNDSPGFYSAEQQHGGATVFEAIAAWKAASQPEDSPLQFESNGKRWWGGFVPLVPTGGQAWVGVAFPKTSVFTLVRQRWSLFAGISVAIIALGAGLALVVVHRYSRQLHRLPKLRLDRNDLEAELFDLIGRGESAHLEFKSTMRANLRSGKNDKAIELAWLKGLAAFMNTEGGILLLGVADNGEILGLAPDAFANDDKCHLHFKNLVNQHLGAEAMQLLTLSLVWIEDKQIGVIECEQSNTPTFLRQANGESFLIRTGPSNSELPISRALPYIDGHF